MDFFVGFFFIFVKFFKVFVSTLKLCVFSLNCHGSSTSFVLALVFSNDSLVILDPFVSVSFKSHGITTTRVEKACL